MTKPPNKPPKKSSKASDEQDLLATTSIELMSTQVLRQMLSDDEVTVADLETVVSDSDDNAMLGRDEHGQFELLEKASLDDLMNSSRGPVERPARSRNAAPEFGYGDDADRAKEPAAKGPRGGEANVRQISLPENDSTSELELVDTQLLRVILDEQLVAQGKKPKFAVDEVPSANPYDSATDPKPTSRFAPEPKRTDEFNPYNTTTKPRK